MAPTLNTFFEKQSPSQIKQTLSMAKMIVAQLEQDAPENKETIDIANSIIENVMMKIKGLENFEKLSFNEKVDIFASMFTLAHVLGFSEEEDDEDFGDFDDDDDDDDEDDDEDDYDDDFDEDYDEDEDLEEDDEGKYKDHTKEALTKIETTQKHKSVENKRKIINFLSN